MSPFQNDRIIDPQSFGLSDPLVSHFHPSICFGFPICYHLRILCRLLYQLHLVFPSSSLSSSVSCRRGMNSALSSSASFLGA